jgi:hypothetical protein
MQSRPGGLLVAALLAIAPAAFGAGEERVPREEMAKLQHASQDTREVRLEHFPLDGRSETLVLEEFDVLAPNAVIERFDDELKPSRVKPSPMRQFRGYVDGEPDSLVYLSTGPHADGVIVSRDRKYIVKQRRGRGGNDDFVVEEVPLLDELAAADDGFRCEAINGQADPIDGFLPRSLTANATPMAVPPWPSATATSVLNLAISTDSALYANFSSNVVSVETYVRNLVGAASVIYKRDLRTELRIVYLQLSQASDPWTINPGTSGTWNGSAVTYATAHALAEFGDYWHNSPPSNVARSGAVLVSGQSQTAGVAWINTICAADFPCAGGNCNNPVYDGHYGGAYAYCGGVGTTSAERTVPNPDSNAGGANPYQINTTSYWGLLQFSHELGHVVRSKHTHCIQLTANEQAQYGVTRSFVDVCYSSATSGCYSGTTSVPSEKGTIMSYCHILSGGATNTRWLFGKANEPSEVVTNTMRAALDAKTPSGLSVITAPSSVTAGASNIASVTATAGLTFDWTITNGTFAGGGTTATGASVTFVGATSPATLRVYATNSQGCAIADYKSVTVGPGVAAPTNVVATATGATSIGVSWTSVAGAVSYQIDRRTGAIWSQIGTSGVNSYNDATAVANTAYLYRVRAVDGSANVSGNSNVDLATAIVFTDASLGSGTTAVRAVHFAELRIAANAVRTLAALTLSSFTDPALSSAVTIKGTHLTELRSAVDPARSALGLGAAGYSDGAPVGVAIKAAHLDELRSAVR